MTNSTLYTLGRAELRSGESGIGALVPMQPKRLALLAYLALTSRENAQSRDRLLAYFWPEAGQEEGRAALRQALHHLRQRLGEAAITSTSDGRVSLDSTLLRCDAVDLETAVGASDDARVLALYRGEFLDGLLPRDTSPEFEEWIDRTRRHLKTVTASAAERVARQATDSGKFDDAISAAARLTELAPDNEEALRLHLQLLEQSGRAGDALALADRATRDFEARLGVPPGKETVALVAEIRARRQAESKNVAVQPVSDVTRSKVDRETAITARRESDSIVQHATTEPAQRSKRTQYSLLAVVFGAAIISVLTIINRSDSSSKNKASLKEAAAIQPVDRLIVTDFTDNGDGLGATVAAALRVDLAQSPRIRVLTGAQVRDAAKRAEITGDLSLDDSLVRTIAVREGIKGFVAGEVNRVARNWLLTARIVDTRDGTPLISVRETAEDSAGLVPAIERLSRALTARTQKTLASQPDVVPLERVTTPSIDALRAYGEGVKLLDEGERMPGIARLEYAVKIDTGFATAWRLLGSAWSSMTEPARAENASRRAFANRDRLTFRERYLLEGSYYRNVTGDYEAAVKSYRTLLDAYPQDLAGINNLALVYVSMGGHVQAESLFNRVIALDSSLVFAHLTLAEQIAMQRRHEDAWRVMNLATRRFPNHPTVRMTPIYIASSAQQWARAESLATARLASGVTDLQHVDALQTLARIELVRGKVNSASKHLSESMTEALKIETPYRYLSGAITAAWLELRYRGNAQAARGELQRALKRVPMEGIDKSDRPTADLVAVMLAAGMKAEAERVAQSEVTPDMAMLDRTYIQGLLRSANGQFAQAAAMLDSASQEPQECAMCVLPVLAAARASAGDASGAIRAAEEYLASPYIHRFEPDAVDLADFLARLAGWYEQRGDVPRATATWRKLLDLWVNADATLASRIADARRHLGGAEAK